MTHSIDTQFSLYFPSGSSDHAALLESLSTAGIQTETLDYSQETGQLRFIAQPSSQLERLLSETGVPHFSEPVLSARMSDEKGRLAELTRALASSGIRVDYVYASVNPKGIADRLIIKVDNAPLASSVLTELDREIPAEAELVSA